MDFGIARQAKDAMLASTTTQTVAGTPLYMAPESEGGVVRKESDLYALGVCFYELLAGESPFEGSGMARCKLKMDYPPVSRRVASLPPKIDAFFARAFQADPERRFGTAEEFAAALDALVKS
jgi:serine/threonine-protein kinase